MNVKSARRLVLVSFFCLAAILTLKSTGRVEAQTDQITIQWEHDSVGNPLSAGQIIDDEFYRSGGVRIAVSAKSASNTVVIFDSSHPTGNDPDLGTPNRTCSRIGTGIGIGGEQTASGQNCRAHGNVLVIADNTNDTNGDNYIDVPGDDERGGVLSLTFAQPVLVESVEVLDQEANDPVAIYIYSDAAGTSLIGIATASGLGDNSFERVSIRTLGVQRLDFDFPAGGAIDNLSFRPMEAVMSAAGVGPFVAPQILLLFAVPLLALGILLAWWWRWLDSSHGYKEIF